MQLPPHVSIIGDNLRSVTIRPATPTKDLFWVNNGCYIAHMTFKDHVSPSAAVAFNPDGSAGVIIMSPYVQNCTSITSTGTGMRVNGNHAQGTKSMVVDAYTQYNQGGIGIHLLNRGYAQLVSVFTICCDKGFFCESGGFCSITNSNSSFGNYALYADGISLPIQSGGLSTSTRKTLTISNLQNRPGVGDAIRIGNTTTYYTVNSSTELTIGSVPVVNPTISNESATLRNARQAILNKKTRIQVDTIIFIGEQYPGFQYNQFKCNRDIATILNCVCYDMILGTNYQSVVAGIAYTRASTAIVKQGQKTETLAAINFVKTQALAALTPATIPYIRVEANFNIILDIIDNGIIAIPEIVYPSPSVVGASTVNAKNQIQANKSFIKAEAIQYLSDNIINFSYNKTTCARDTGLIIDGLVTDLLYPDNGYTQSIFAGLQYWSQGSYTGQIPNEINTTTSALIYLKGLVEDTATYNSGSDTQKNAVSDLFTYVIGILESGVTNITNQIIPNGDISSDEETQAVYGSIIASKATYQQQVLDYISSTYPTFVYDRATCLRDVGYIIDSVAFDLLHGGNRQSVMSGVYYYSYSSSNSVIAGEQSQTTAAYDRLRDILPMIVTNELIDPSIGNTSTQNILLAPATYAEGEELTSMVNTITRIINKGPSAADPKRPAGLSIDTSTNKINAYEVLKANSDFIVEEVISYIDDLTNFTYNQSKCSRDTGLIVDALAFDILYDSNHASQSTFAGLQYWNQNGYTGQISSELTTTSNAIAHARDLAVNLVTLGYQDTVRNNFNALLYVINTGTAGITDMIIPNGAESTDANLLSQYNILISNKSTIQQGTIDWINSNNPNFNYNTSTCYRDIGYIIDSVAFDLRNGGNKQSIMAGVYYYGFSATTSAITGEIPQTVAAYNFIKHLGNKIIKGIPVESYQNTVTQFISANTATSVEVDLLDQYVSTITNIIKNGPTVAPVKSPIGLTASTDANKLNAFNLLLANRTFIQAETIAYVNDTFTNISLMPSYNKNTCRRDTRLVIDAVALDLLYTENGYSQSNFAGLQYWSQGNYTGRIPKEIDATKDAVSYLKSLVAADINGAPETTTNGLFDTLLTILDNGTSGITDQIILNGPISTSTSVLSAYNTIVGAKTTYQQKVINYINTSYAAFEYNTSTCYRDVGFIIDSIALDLLRGGNKQTIQSGVYYYSYSSAVSVISTETAQTTIAYNRLRDILPSIVTNQLVTPTFKNTATQNTSLPAATILEGVKLEDMVNTITDIINNGPTVVGAKKPVSLNLTSDDNAVKAAAILAANKDFIKSEVLAYIDYEFSTFNYNKATCYRDTGLIVDAIVQDLLFEGRSQSTFAGLQYWSQDSYVGDIARELTTTTLAINFVKSLAHEVIRNDSTGTRYQSTVTQVVSTSSVANSSTVNLLNSEFDIVLNILANGTVGITDQIVPNSIEPTTVTNVINAYNILQENRRFIQSETIAYINSTSPFDYNQVTCYRDVGYILDSISFDMLYGGNKQAIQSGVYYWGYVSTSSVVATEIEQTNRAYQYISALAQSIVQGEIIYDTYQDTYKQVSSVNVGTTAEGSVVTDIINTITNIIANGPSVSGPKIPIGLTITTSTAVLNAAMLLHRNRQFIQEEVIGYIDDTTVNLPINDCQRDIEYILNAVSYDLLYGGNSQTSVAAQAYYNGTKLSISQEVNQVLLVYSFMNTLIQEIVLGNSVTPLQNAIPQDTSNNSGTDFEIEIVDKLFGVIENILTQGYTTTVTLEESLRILPEPGTAVSFHQYSLIVSTGHSFEWIGAGTDINAALPYLGGEPIASHQGFEINGGKVNFTGTDQRGDFRIGNDLVINRSNGTISGRTFNKSLFAVMTPYILAIGA